MPSIYDKIAIGSKSDKDGNVAERYRINKMFVSEDKVPEAVKNVITLDNMVDELGNIVVDYKNEEGRQPEPAPPEAPAAPADNQEDTTDAPDVPSPADEQIAAAVNDANEDQQVQAPAEPLEPADNPQPPTAPDVTSPTPPEGEAPTGPENDPDIDKDITAEDDDLDEDDSEDDSEDDESTKKQDSAPPEVDTPPEEPKETPRKSRAMPSRGKVEDKFKSKVPQSTQGMGAPRANGVTPSIFDPGGPKHTHVKLVGGHAVPLTAEEYNTKSDTEIMHQMEAVGYEIVDFNVLEQAQNQSDTVGGNGLLMEDQEIDEDIQLG